MTQLTADCREGFEMLMIGTNSIIHSPVTADVTMTTHPFPELPEVAAEHIVYLNYSMTIEEARGFIRIVGWELTDGSGAMLDSGKVYFLRKIDSDPNPEAPTQQYHFYEIGIDTGADTTIYMTGEDMYDHAPQQASRRSLDVLFRFLSQVYGVEIQEVRITHIQGQMATERINREREQEKAEMKDYRDRLRRNEQIRPHFHKGQQVVWSVQAYRACLTLAPKKSDVLKVIGVEIIPNYCNCGLGDGASIRFHREGRCNLKRRHMNMHHQVLTVQLGSRKERVSGHYLFPFEAL